MFTLCILLMLVQQPLSAVLCTNHHLCPSTGHTFLAAFPEREGPSTLLAIPATSGAKRALQQRERERERERQRERERDLFELHFVRHLKT